MIELDHIFVFTSKGAPEAQALIDLGLKEGPRNTHPGQGTSDRRFFFERTHFELLWVQDEEEVRSPIIAPTHLWERSRSQQTGYSPFGVCVRPSAERLKNGPQSVLPATWNYVPPYLPNSMRFVVVDNGSFPQEPMLFQLPFERKPNNDKVPQSMAVNHPIGVRNITKVNLQAPAFQNTSSAMARLLETDWLNFELVGDFHLTLEFDGCRRQQEEDFSPQLPLTIKW